MYLIFTSTTMYMKCFCICESESIWKRVLTVSLRVLIQYNAYYITKGFHLIVLLNNSLHSSNHF